MLGSRSLRTFLIVLAAAALSGLPPIPGHAQQDGLASLRTLMAEADSAMQTIERELNQISDKKQIEERGDALEKNIETAALAADRAFKALIGAARQEAARPSNANLGGALNDFEKTMTAQRDRAAGILRKLGEVQNAVHQGSILVSPKVFDGVSAKDRATFLKSLSPEAQQTYKRTHPRLFSGMDVKFAILSDYATAALQYGLDSCVTDANAVLAAGCVAVCAGSAGTACAGCLLAAAGTTYVIVRYTNCKATCGSCRWYRPWACVCRAACLAAMVAAIAENASPAKFAALDELRVAERE